MMKLEQRVSEQRKIIAAAEAEIKRLEVEMNVHRRSLQLRTRIIAAAEAEIKRLEVEMNGERDVIDGAVVSLKASGTEFLRARRDKLNIELATVSEKAIRQTEGVGVRKAIRDSAFQDQPGTPIRWFRIWSVRGWRVIVWRDA